MRTKQTKTRKQKLADELMSEIAALHTDAVIHPHRIDLGLDRPRKKAATHRRDDSEQAAEADWMRAWEGQD